MYLRLHGCLHFCRFSAAENVSAQKNVNINEANTSDKVFQGLPDNERIIFMKKNTFTEEAADSNVLSAPAGQEQNEAAAAKRRSKKFSTYRMVTCALFAAVLCVLSPVSVSIGPVPISLGLFAVLLTVVVLEPVDSTIAVIIYLLLGAFGLPVFAGGTGGFTRLAGPTGGYLWSYIFVALASGYLIRTVRKIKLSKRSSTRILTTILVFLSCLIGVAICYLLGTLYYSRLYGVTFAESLAVCVIPFIGVDILKSLAAAILGCEIRRLIRYDLRIRK